MKPKTLIALGGALVLATLVTHRPSVAQEQGGKKTAPSSTGPKSITLPQVEPNLPDAPGRDAVASACVVCHSTRYITMQPAFPREVWVASVDKMRKVFGAPITNEQVPVIVDYLVAIRGAKPAAKAP